LSTHHTLVFPVGRTSLYANIFKWQILVKSGKLYFRYRIDVYFDTYLSWKDVGNCIIELSFRKNLRSAKIRVEYMNKRKKAVRTTVVRISEISLCLNSYDTFNCSLCSSNLSTGQ
jgi:hypothetical protein